MIRLLCLVIGMASFTLNAYASCGGFEYCRGEAQQIADSAGGGSVTCQSSTAEGFGPNLFGFIYYQFQLGNQQVCSVSYTVRGWYGGVICSNDFGRAACPTLKHHSKQKKQTPLVSK
jgi:hypothetical protein